MGIYSQHGLYLKWVNYSADDMKSGFPSSSLVSTVFYCLLFVNNSGVGYRCIVCRNGDLGSAGVRKWEAPLLTLGIPTGAGPALYTFVSSPGLDQTFPST